jgi:tetratricopeptide (TPR) repeat protein
MNKLATGLLLGIVMFTVTLSADDSRNSLPRETRDPQRLLAMGRANDAIGTLQQRIHENPNDAQAWNLLARAYLGEEQWDKAVEAAEKSVALAPNSAEYHSWLGRAYGDKADHISHVNFVSALRLAKKTHSEFERAVALDPTNVAAQSDLGEFLLEAPGIVGGGTDKAQRVRQQLAMLDAATGHWLQARIAEKANHIEEAEREYHAAIDSSQQKAQYWLNLASFFRRRNRLDDMEEAIQQAVASSSRDGVLMEAAELLVRTNRNFNAAGKWLRQYLTAAEPVEADPAFQAHYLLGSIFEKQGDRNSAAQEYRNALQLASAYTPAVEALKRVQQ